MASSLVAGEKVFQRQLRGGISKKKVQAAKKRLEAMTKQHLSPFQEGAGSSKGMEETEEEDYSLERVCLGLLLLDWVEVERGKRRKNRELLSELMTGTLTVDSTDSGETSSSGEEQEPDLLSSPRGATPGGPPTAQSPLSTTMPPARDQLSFSEGPCRPGPAGATSPALQTMSEGSSSDDLC